MNVISVPKLAPQTLVDPQPDDQQTISLGPGVWCLHTFSTVPFVRIDAGDESRDFTWGEAVRITRPGKLVNASAHVGDVWIAPVVEGVVAAAPASITLPALFEEDVSVAVGQIGRWKTQFVDVRRARRVFFQYTLSVPATYPAMQVQQRFSRGQMTDAQGATALAGAGSLLQYTKTPAAGDLAVNLAPSLSSAQPGDSRPGAFFESLRTGTVANPGAVLPWYTLEYV